MSGRCSSWTGTCHSPTAPSRATADDPGAGWSSSPSPTPAISTRRTSSRPMSPHPNRSLRWERAAPEPRTRGRTEVARETAQPIDVQLLQSWSLPSSSGDKSDRGTVLVVGGPRRTPGAVLLAAETALRVGAGKVQVATVADTAAALAVALPEALVEGLPALQSGELAVAGADRVVELAEAADVVLLGPGLRDPDCADLFLSQVVPRLDTALVLDALGTAYLTGNLDGVRHL